MQKPPYPAGLEVLILVWAFPYVHTSCLQEAMDSHNALTVKHPALSSSARWLLN